MNPVSGIYPGFKCNAGMRLGLCALVVLILAHKSLHADEPLPPFSQPAPIRFPSLFCWEGTCNSYVLRDGDAALVIDCGDAEYAGALEQIGVKHIDWLLFTDHHRELNQGIDRIRDAESKVAAPAAEKELFENPTHFRKWFPKLGDKYSVYGDKPSCSLITSKEVRSSHAI